MKPHSCWPQTSRSYGKQGQMHSLGFYSISTAFYSKAPVKTYFILMKTFMPK